MPKRLTEEGRQCKGKSDFVTRDSCRDRRRHGHTTDLGTGDSDRTYEGHTEGTQRAPTRGRDVTE